MNAAMWERVKDAFNEISDSTPAECAHILSGLPETERHEVERMLAEAETSGTSLGDSDPYIPNAGAMMERLVSEQHAFSEGQVLLDRFEIRHFVGAGATGEVYEAHDRILGDVAIKTLRPEHALSPPMLESFRREVNRGRRVSHPNVCRIYEIFEIPEASDSEVPFFTMELLPGRTLAAAVQERAGFGEPEARTIALQLCAGLHAAHEAGILHCDLKAGNVILAEGAGRGVHAKITDFGLACLRPLGRPHNPDFSGAVAGTRQYLSGDLMDGDQPSVASDLFALGVVLFFLTTARYPFDPQASWAKAKEDRRNPPAFRELLHLFNANWARAISSCLAFHPGDRPASAAEVAEMLAGTETKGRSLTRRGLIYALAGTSAVTVWAETWGKHWLSPELPSGKLKTLVEEFDTAGAPASVGRAVQNLLRLSLRSSPRIELISAREIQSEIEKRGLGGQPLRGQVAQDVARQTSSRLAISGTVRAEGGRYRIRCQAVDPQSAAVLLAPREVVTAAKDIPAAVLSLSKLIRERVGAEMQLAEAGSLPLEETDTENSDALENFTLGLSYYRAGEPDAALVSLREATRLDSDFAIAYCYQALVLYSSRKGDQALAPIQSAYRLRDKLNPHHRLYIEFYNFLISGDWDRAHDRLQVLLKFFPDDPDLNRQLAQSYALLQQPENALVPARRTVDLDPDNPMNVSMLIICLGENDRIDEAHAVLTQALQRFPDSPPLLYSQSQLYLIEFKSRETLQVLERLSKGRPSGNLTKTQTVKALMLAAEWDQARKELERQISVQELADSRQVQSLSRYWLGQIYWLGNNPNGAAMQASLLLKDREALPSNLGALRNAAELGWLSGRPEIVRGSAEKIRSIAHAHPSTRSLGFLHLAEGLEAWMSSDRERSLASLAKAVELWPDLTDVWASGELLMQSQRFAEAADAFQRVISFRASALRFDSLNLWVHSFARLALCLEAMGRRDQANAYWARFTHIWGAPSRYSFTQAGSAV